MKTSFLFLLLCVPNFLLFAQPITEQNWLTHPDILEIRRQYQEIQQDITAGLITTKTWERSYEEPYGDTERIWFLDQQARTRVFKKFGGSGDSALQRSFFYDLEGNLMFVFVKGGSVNGTSIEHRIYVKDGKRIWEKQQMLSGPGWGFPNPWPEEDLEWKPTKWTE